MGRWIALGITLACFGSCSFISQSVFRGMLAPVGVIVFGFITLLLFAQARVRSSARPPAAALLDAETQVLLRQRASRLAKRSSASPESQASEADTDSHPSGSTR